MVVSPTLAVALAKARSRSAWNDRLTAWERPASDNEAARIERAAASVREALAENLWLNFEGVQIRTQGSYHNNTNVRLQADMDLHAWHPLIRTMYAANVHVETARAALCYQQIARTLDEVAADFRQQIEVELKRAFGGANVSAGNMAFNVRNVPGNRAPADVTPVFRFHYLKFVGFAGESPQYTTTEGVYIIGRDGKERINFPEQHHANGIAKREKTAYRYKRVVRCFKHLRDELIISGLLKAGRISSYLIECMLYSASDQQYLYDEDRWARMVGILEHLWDRLHDPDWTASAVEVNEVKLLFHDTQPWSLVDAQAFVAAAYARLTA